MEKDTEYGAGKKGREQKLKTLREDFGDSHQVRLATSVVCVSVDNDCIDSGGLPMST